MSLRLDCPSLESWQALLDVNLSAEQRHCFETHLEACPVCQECLDQAAVCGADFRGVARRVGDPTEAPADPLLLQVIERLRQEQLPARTGLEEPLELYFLRPAEPPLLGYLDKYEVLEVLGQGGMGVVLKAYEPALHRLVAIKVLSPALAGSSSARQRFTREAQAAAAVCHENIVAVHGVHEVNGLPYLVMQYVAGESLQQRLDRTGPLELAEVVRIGCQTASGLAAAHAQGLIHRDIKPANLLLENGDSRVKITDFGLARMRDDVGLTQNGVVVGTPEYMAPEQARSELIDQRADLFSLGGVLYALCTGQPPFRGSTTMVVLLQVSNQTPTPIRALNPEVSAWLEALITRLLAKDPAIRFQSAAEVKTLLEGYLAHLRQPVAYPAPPPLPAAAGKPGSRRRFGAKGGLLALVLVLLLAVGSTVPFAGGGGQPGAASTTPRVEHWTLKGDPAKGQEVELIGPDAAACVRRERDGTVIALPAGHPGTRPSTGLLIPSPVQGDFEITVRFEILQAPLATEAGPQGTRFTLDLFLDRPGVNMATLSWTRKPKLQTGWIPFMILRNEATGANDQQADARPTQAKSGRLRIVRTGSLLTYCVAEDQSEEFLYLREYPFVPDDVQDIRLVGSTGGPQAALTVRVTDLHIRSQSAAEPVGDSQPALPRKLFRPWLVVAGFLGLGLIGMLCLCLWLSRQHRANATEQEAEGPAKDTSSPGTPAKPALSFRCSGCGKNLRVRAALAGKKVRCPRCGQQIQAAPA